MVNIVNADYVPITLILGMAHGAISMFSQSCVLKCLVVIRSTTPTQTSLWTLCKANIGTDNHLGKDLWKDYMRDI